MHFSWNHEQCISAVPQMQMEPGLRPETTKKSPGFALKGLLELQDHIISLISDAADEDS